MQWLHFDWLKTFVSACIIYLIGQSCLLKKQSLASILFQEAHRCFQVFERNWCAFKSAHSLLTKPTRLKTRRSKNWSLRDSPASTLLVHKSHSRICLSTRRESVKRFDSLSFGSDSIYFAFPGSHNSTQIGWSHFRSLVS